MALAFVPGQGDELKHRPRDPHKPIFNRLMIERVGLTSITTGILAFVIFNWIQQTGASVDDARNYTLMLLVLFENINVFNSRSETVPVFKQNLFGNRLLLAGTIAAHLIHIGAMYTPGLHNVLHVQPIAFEHWLMLVLYALTILLLNELYKVFNVRWPGTAVR